MLRRPVLPVAGLLTATLLVGATAGPAAARGDRGDAASFAPVTTFPVAGEVAEILAATPDGRTLLYTDSARGEVGLVDVSRPDRPQQTGAVAVGGSPTSVAVTKDGRYALVAVDTTQDLTTPSGVLAVVDLRGRQVVRTLELGGQPDSVAVSPDGRYAAVAIENQRDEELEVDGVEGGLPQLPSGFLSVVPLQGKVTSWTAVRVELAGLPGMAHPTDPEPEFVDIDRRNVAAVTLQENNAVALVDLAMRRVVGSFSAGTVTRTDADTAPDGTATFDDRLTAPREPDAVQWTPDGNLITADEGDLAAEPSGGRGWTVFSPSGRELFSSGGSAEQALAREGRYPDDRSDDKGAEFEGAEVAQFRGTEYAFIGSERGDAVLVYDLDRESRPELRQVLATGDAPEGLLALPARDLFLASNEDDGTISVFALQRPRGGSR